MAAPAPVLHQIHPGGINIPPANPYILNRLVNVELIQANNNIYFYILKRDFIAFYKTFLWKDNIHDFYSNRGGDSTFRNNLVLDMLQLTSFGLYNNMNNNRLGTLINPLYQSQDYFIQNCVGYNPPQPIVNPVTLLFLNNINDYYNNANFKGISSGNYNGFFNRAKRTNHMGGQNNNLNIYFRTGGNDHLLYCQRTYVVEEEVIITHVANIQNGNHFFNIPHENGVLYKFSGILGIARSTIFWGHIRTSNIIRQTAPIINVDYRSNLVQTQVDNAAIPNQAHIEYVCTKDTTNAGFAHRGVPRIGINEILGQLLPNGVLNPVRSLGINGRVDGNYVENRIDHTRYYYPDVSIYMTLHIGQNLYGCIYMVKWFLSSIDDIQNITRIFFVVRIVSQHPPLVGAHYLTTPHAEQWLYNQQIEVCNIVTNVGLGIFPYSIMNRFVANNTINASFNPGNDPYALPDINNGLVFMDTTTNHIGPEVNEYKTFITRYRNNNFLADTFVLDLGSQSEKTGIFIILNQLRRISIALYKYLFVDSVGGVGGVGGVPRINSPHPYILLNFIIAFLLRYKQKGDEAHATDGIQLEATFDNYKSIVCTNDGYLEKLLLNMNTSYVISSNNQRTFYFAPKDITVPAPTPKITGTKTIRDDNDDNDDVNRTRQSYLDFFNSIVSVISTFGDGLKRRLVDRTMGSTMGSTMCSSMVKITKHDLKNAFTQDYSLERIQKQITDKILSKKEVSLVEMFDYKYHQVTSSIDRTTFTFRDVIIESVIALGNISESFTESDVPESLIPISPAVIKRVLQIKLPNSTEENISDEMFSEELKQLMRQDIQPYDYQKMIQLLSELCDIDYSENDPEDYTNFDVNLSIIQHWVETISIYRELSEQENLIKFLILRSRCVLSSNRKETQDYDGKETQDYDGKETQDYDGKETQDYDDKETQDYDDKETQDYDGKETQDYDDKETQDYDDKETSSEVELKKVVYSYLSELLKRNNSTIPHKRRSTMSRFRSLFRPQTKKLSPIESQGGRRRIQTKKRVKIYSRKSNRKNKTRHN